MRLSRLVYLPAALLLVLSTDAEAQRQSKKVSLPTCEALPPPSEMPWDPAERLYYDIDVMGALAGKLTMTAHPPVGTGGSQEVVLRAMAASNSFFSKIRQVRGRASSTVRTQTFRPRQYMEESQEGSSERSAKVVFQRPSAGRVVKLDWKRDGRSGKNNFRYSHDAFDPLSAAYAIRTLDLEQGQELCFDTYGIRKLWRVSGVVMGIETVKVPAGTFQAYRLEGTAYRVDSPRRNKEVHLWISADERRLPLAVLSVLDLGPVRAQLTRVDGAIDEELEGAVIGDLPPPPPAPRPVRRLQR